MSIHERVQYERLDNGMDLYLLPGGTRDMVVLRLALPGGTFATYKKQIIADLFETLMPTGTRTSKRRIVRESFDRLGAQVSIAEGAAWLTVTLVCRPSVFLEASSLLAMVLTQPKVTASEFAQAVAELDTNLEHVLDDTRAQASLAMMHALYAPGHPHYTPSPRTLRKELRSVALADVLTFHRNTLNSVGGVAVVVGDCTMRTVGHHLRATLSALPARAEADTSALHADRTLVSAERDLVVPMRDRMNIDTLLAIPLALTREHTDYYALQIGVAILGGSSTGRLENSLRARQSMTYTSRAVLGGMADGFPGYVSAWAIFPNDIFRKGRTAFRDEVARWAEKGVTASELARRKEEITGGYTVGLASTRGIAGALFGALVVGRTSQHLDEYPRIIESLTLRDVNRAIREHIHYDLAVTAAAGAIDADGKVLV